MLPSVSLVLITENLHSTCFHQCKSEVDYLITDNKGELFNEQF